MRYPRVIRLTKIAVLGMALLGVHSSAAFGRSNLKVVEVRNGLPNVQARLARKEPLRIAFLGGSITQNAGVNGFVEALPRQLRAHYAEAQIDVLNSGKAGTGSDFGAQRIDRDVLGHRPNMLIVEFAVNDSNRACLADMERIVRKTWMSDPGIDILFLYTVARGDLSVLAKGDLPAAVRQHERVADYYGIPSLHLGVGLHEGLSNGSLTWEEFSADDCHPSSAGYQLYNRLLESSLSACLAARDNRPHQLSAPIVAHLVVYPPPRAPQSLPVEAPFVSADGRMAARTYRLPVVGVHWVGAPEFKVNGTTGWSLYFQPAENPPVLDPVVGVDRHRWTPQAWFEEAGAFTGSTSDVLVGNKDGTNLFGASASETSVLVFRAERSGEYIFRTSLQDIEGFSDRSKSVALNLVHFPAEASLGRSIDFHTSSRGDMKPREWETRLRMHRGDSLAYVFLKRDLGNAHYTGFSVRVGSYDDPGH